MNQEAKLDWHERIANEQERGASNSRKEGRKKQRPAWTKEAAKIDWHERIVNEQECGL